MKLKWRVTCWSGGGTAVDRPVLVSWLGECRTKVQDWPVVSNASVRLAALRTECPKRPRRCRTFALNLLKIQISPPFLNGFE